MKVSRKDIESPNYNQKIKDRPLSTIDFVRSQDRATMLCNWKLRGRGKAPSHHIITVLPTKMKELFDSGENFTLPATSDAIAGPRTRARRFPRGPFPERQNRGEIRRSARRFHRPSIAFLAPSETGWISSYRSAEDEGFIEREMDKASSLARVDQSPSLDLF